VGKVPAHHLGYHIGSLCSLALSREAYCCLALEFHLDGEVRHQRGKELIPGHIARLCGLTKGSKGKGKRVEF
jgi:hypothetical protein